ncbi:GNAT family N-acetyltransferase [Endothiovibrio diazotrophicus]
MGRLSPPEPLTAEHHTAGFDSESDSLDEWLVRRALKNETSGGSRTYVVCDGLEVVGYYAIAAGSVARAETPGRISRNQPAPVPAVILGRLAVDRNWKGRGIGRGLLKDATLRSLNVSRQIGARALLVHALDEQAAAFYRHHGFIDNPLAPATLMLGLLDQG